MFTSANLETSLHRELKLDKRGMHREKGSLLVNPWTYILSEESSWNKGGLLDCPSQTEPYRLVGKSCCQMHP